MLKRTQRDGIEYDDFGDDTYLDVKFNFNNLSPKPDSGNYMSVKIEKVGKPIGWRNSDWSMKWQGKGCFSSLRARIYMQL